MILKFSAGLPTKWTEAPLKSKSTRAPPLPSSVAAPAFAIFVDEDLRSQPTPSQSAEQCGDARQALKPCKFVRFIQ